MVKKASREWNQYELARTTLLQIGLALQNHKELYQIRETILDKRIRQQKLTLITHVIRRENSDIRKMLTFQNFFKQKVMQEHWIEQKRVNLRKLQLINMGTNETPSSITWRNIHKDVTCCIGHQLEDTTNKETPVWTPSSYLSFATRKKASASWSLLV